MYFSIGIVPHEPVAPEQLDGVRRDPHRGVGGEELGHGPPSCSFPEASVERAGRGAHELTGGFAIRVAMSASLPLDHLERR
jgi:hypothetical protein